MDYLTKMEALTAKAKRLTEEKERATTALIQKALNHCGYQGEPTAENLKDCFLDYVDAGCFANLTEDEAVDLIDDGEITVQDMVKNLLKV